MAKDSHVSRGPEGGFSLVEVIVVILIIGILAAISFPAIANWTRNYKIKGAAQEVAGELQSARSRAISSNTNTGVSFLTVDADSYRFVQEDMLADIAGGVLPVDSEKSALKHLPTGIRFVTSGTANAGPALRFQRLGGFCIPGVASCTVPPASFCSSGEAGYCQYEAAGDFIGTAAGGTAVITLLEENTGLQRVVRVAPGGRVLHQEGWEP